MGEITLGDYLCQQGASSDAIMYLYGGLENDSLLELLHDKVFETAPMSWKIRGGNDRLPHAMAEPLRENIRYGAVVVRIVQKQDHVEVTYTYAGSHHTVLADCVICTLPFSILRGIEVQPQWSPSKAFAIQNLYMGPVARVYAQTKTRFWEADGCNGFATADQPMEIWSPTFNQPGKRGIVMSYIYEDLAVQYSGISEEAQVQQSLDLFEQIHPHTFATHVSSPSEEQGFVFALVVSQLSRDAGQNCSRIVAYDVFECLPQVQFSSIYASIFRDGPTGRPGTL